ncbi:MAG: DUF5658 family protein [Nitriliruptor sp.]
MDTLERWAARWDARVNARRGRLRRRAPRISRGFDATTRSWQRVIDALVPGRRAVTLTAVLIVMTLVDSAATYAWVSRAVAVEGNPLVDDVITLFGEGPGLALRTGFSALLLTLLGLLARRFREARGGLAVVAVVLSLVTGIHLYGAWLVLTGAVSGTG